MDIERDINYICNYIKYVFFNIEGFKDNKNVIDVARKIKSNMPNSDFYSGKLDFYINNFVAQHLRTRNSNSYLKFQAIKNHIYLVMNYYKIYEGKEIANYDGVLCEIMRIICSKYSYEEIIDGKSDTEIEALIQADITYNFNPDANEVKIPINIMYISSNEGEVVDSREYMYTYILRLLEKDKDLFIFDGNLSILAEMICEDMCRFGVKSDDVLAHEYDDLILAYIRKNKFGIKFEDKFRNIHSEVSKYVMDNNTYMELSDHGEKESIEIFNLSQHLLEQGFSAQDILSGKCDDIMERHLRIDCIKSNSKLCKTKEKGKQNPNKFLLSLNKTFYSKKTKALILGMVMILGAGIIGETIPKETLVDYELIDEYEYPNIPYEMSNEYAETLSHIMNQYIENASIGKEYGQICLYKAFQSIKSEPYSVMDSMFQLIKERAKYNEEILPLYEDIKDSESYIDYMYKSLSKEGSSKITDDITSAVETYNSQVANYRELNAFGLLDKSEKSSIEKMEKMYGKQIKQLENEIEKDYGKEK